MNLPDLPSSWSNEHSLAIILLIVTAVDGQIDTVELGEVERRLDALNPERSVASVHLAQDAYEYLLKVSQLVEDDAELVKVVRVHAERVNSFISRDRKFQALNAILAISEVDEDIDPTEIEVYKAAADIWHIG